LTNDNKKKCGQAERTTLGFMQVGLRNKTSALVHIPAAVPAENHWWAFVHIIIF